MTHTATPWTLDTLTTKAGRAKLGLSVLGSRVCDISIYTAEDEKLARFMLKAVNAHDELVAALKDARDCLERTKQSRDAFFVAGTHVLENIEAILAKVQS